MVRTKQSWEDGIHEIIIRTISYQDYFGQSLMDDQVMYLFGEFYTIINHQEFFESPLNNHSLGLSHTQSS
jgi:hypothetical protein